MVRASVIFASLRFPRSSPAILIRSRRQCKRLAAVQMGGALVQKCIDRFSEIGARVTALLPFSHFCSVYLGAQREQRLLGCAKRQRRLRYGKARNVTGLAF